MTKKILIVLIILFVGVGGYYLGTRQVATKNSEDKIVIKSFEECVAAGYPVLESFPRQCKTSRQMFAENVGNSLEKSELIVLDSPKPNEKIVSPLSIKGKARGGWFFEAQFPIELVDGNGNQIATIPAKAMEDWMSPDFVNFSAILTFTKPSTSKGELILKKDNPSGLPQNDDNLRIPVTF